MEWVCYRDFRHESMLRDAGFGLRRKIFLVGTAFSGFGCSAVAEGAGFGGEWKCKGLFVEIDRYIDL